MTVLARQLMTLTGMSKSDFWKIVHTAPRRYKDYTIPKKSGGRREISQPAREVKALQRALMEILLYELPIHDAAAAYLRGKSIRDNALAHAGSGPILKMDFTNFFPSIRAGDWAKYCKEKGILDEEDIQISTLIMFRLKKKEIIPKLTIGAPSSPILSNILLFDFDKKVSAEASKRGISYTRYADDLTFSGQRIGMLSDMEEVVRRTVRETRHPKLRVNRAKTNYVTSAFRRTVTGVTLTNEGGVSVGRDRKRLIRSKIDHAIKGELSAEELRILAGDLSFVNVVEPDQIGKWRQKFGDDAIDMIQRSVDID